MRQLTTWLKGHGPGGAEGQGYRPEHVDQGPHLYSGDGHENFPDGEIFTGPVEDSVNGWVRFQYPAIYGGREVMDVELWFENGRVVKEKAAKGEELLTSLLNTDAGCALPG